MRADPQHPSARERGGWRHAAAPPYDELTRPATRADVPEDARVAPLPVLDDPRLPAVDRAEPGELVPVTSAGLRDLAAYARAGWSQAVPRSLVRREVAERLAAVVDDLPTGFGLAVFDGWRPLALQQALFDTLGAAAPPGYVSPPSADPRTPPPHLTGGTVDLTLTRDGRPLALGTDFDHFGPAAHPDATEPHDVPARTLRRLLYAAMRRQGFVVHHMEWWHFEHGTPRWAALTGRQPRFGPIAPTSDA